MRSATSRHGKQGARAAWPVSPSQFTLDRVRDVWRSVQGKGAAQAPATWRKWVREVAVRADPAGSRASSAPQPCPPGQSVSRRRRMAARCFTQRPEDKSLRGGKEFAPQEHPPTPKWKGRHALRAGPCLVRQRTCGRCRNLALDALSAQKTRGSHPWVGGPCGPLADNLGRSKRKSEAAGDAGGD